MFKLETIKSKNLLEEKTLGFLTTEFDLLIIDFESNRSIDHLMQNMKYSYINIFIQQLKPPDIENET